MRYFISDLHFYHQNLNEQMDCRGFADGKTLADYPQENEALYKTLTAGAAAQ